MKRGTAACAVLAVALSVVLLVLVVIALTTAATKADARRPVSPREAVADPRGAAAVWGSDEGIGAGVVIGKDYLAFPTAAYGTKTALLVIVRSSADEVGAKQRKTVRETWLSKEESFNARHVFVVAPAKETVSPVLAEAKEYGDILVLSASSVGPRSVGSGDAALLVMRWVAHAVPRSVTHVLRVGPDVFVNLAVAAKVAADLGRAYRGFMLREAPNELDKTKAGYFLELMPQHPRPDAYLLSRDLVDHVASMFPMLRAYSTEERSVGIWMSPLDVAPVHDTRFEAHQKNWICSAALAGNVPATEIIAMHASSAAEFEELAARVSSTGALCLRPVSATAQSV